MQGIGHNVAALSHLSPPHHPPPCCSLMSVLTLASEGLVICKRVSIGSLGTAGGIFGLWQGAKLHPSIRGGTTLPAHKEVIVNYSQDNLAVAIATGEYQKKLKAALIH